MESWEFDWTCPQCGTGHHWSWPPEKQPALGDAAWLECEGCSWHSNMRWAGETIGWRFEGHSSGDQPRSEQPLA